MSAPPSNPPTPPSLLERLRQPGDGDAWDWFARLYTPLLFHWAKKAGLQDSDAADLVQEVFTLLVRKLPEFQYEPGRSFRGWLHTVLLNKWRELCRRRSPTAQEADLDALPAPTALENNDYRRELVGRALRLLKSDFRPPTWNAFWQTMVLGHPVNEVAKSLGLTANSVRVAKCRVLQRLRAELDGLLT